MCPGRIIVCKTKKEIMYTRLTETISWLSGKERAAQWSEDDKLVRVLIHCSAAGWLLLQEQIPIDGSTLD